MLVKQNLCNCSIKAAAEQRSPLGRHRIWEFQKGDLRKRSYLQVVDMALPRAGPGMSWSAKVYNAMAMHVANSKTT